MQLGSIPSSGLDGEVHGVLFQLTGLDGEKLQANIAKVRSSKHSITTKSLANAANVYAQIAGVHTIATESLASAASGLGQHSLPKCVLGSRSSIATSHPMIRQHVMKVPCSTRRARAVRKSIFA
jgi:hypothetical protein